MADGFYETIPIFENFADAVRSENYSPLPDDWVVGFADVVGSTKAVADGRYKAVNMVGAGAIAAVANALDRRPFPFVFGGDGASFAVSSSDATAAAKALRAMAAFAREEQSAVLLEVALERPHRAIRHQPQAIEPGVRHGLAQDLDRSREAQRQLRYERRGPADGR